MPIQLASANEAFLPSESGPLIVQPVIQASIATQVCTVVQSGAATFRVPVVTADGSAAWTPESTDITPSVPTLDEAVAEFRALKALTPISNEAYSDITPDVANIIGQGLARDIAKKLDAAFFGTAVVGAPAGIGGITPTTVSAGGAWTDADPFIEAIYAGESLGVTINSFIANPVDALAIAQVKEGSTSVRSLIQPDATQAGRRVVAGVPLFTSPAVAAGTIWAVPRDRVLVVIRKDVDIQVDASAAFRSDETLIRVVFRVGWVFPHELAVVRISKV